MFIIDETMIQIGREMNHGCGFQLYNLLEVLFQECIYLSRHRNTIVAESFLKSLVKIHGKHALYIQMVLEHDLLKLVLL